eukprot:2495002-Rhodomonas_salina.2
MRRAIRYISTAHCVAAYATSTGHREARAASRSFCTRDREALAQYRTSRSSRVVAYASSVPQTA